MAIVSCRGKIILNEDEAHDRRAPYPCIVSHFDPAPATKKRPTKAVLKLYVPMTIPWQERFIASQGAPGDRSRLECLYFTNTQLEYMLRSGKPLKSIEVRCPTSHRAIHLLEKGTRCATGDRLFTHGEALVSTYVPPAVMARVQPGDRARMRPMDWPGEGRKISARVVKVKDGSYTPASPFYGHNLLLRMHDAAPEYDLGTPMDIRIEVKGLPDNFDVEARRPPPPLPTLTDFERRGAAGRLKVRELERLLRQRAKEVQAADSKASVKQPEDLTASKKDE